MRIDSSRLPWCCPFQQEQNDKKMLNSTSRCRFVDEVRNERIDFRQPLEAQSTAICRMLKLVLVRSRIVLNSGWSFGLGIDLGAPQKHRLSKS
jgi:hypothetical protein